MNRVVVLGVTLACALSLSACSRDTPGPAVEQAVGVPIDAPRISLTTPGSGETRVLAYHDIDQEQSITAAVTTGFAQDVVKTELAEGFRSNTLSTAVTTLPLKVQVSTASDAAEGQADATRNVFFTVGTPTYSGSTDLSTAKGFQFGWRAVDSGQISSLRLAAPRDATDEARAQTEKAVDALVSLPAIFPSDAVGVGATWTVDSRVTGDNTLLQTVTYTLKSFNGDTVELGVDVQQRPTLGALSLGDQDATGSLDVKGSHSTTSGTLTVDLNKPLPVAGSIDITTAVIYGQSSSPVSVVQTTVTDVNFNA